MKYTSKLGHPIDVYVGQRVCQLRRQRGLSQQQLADKLGIPVKEVDGYERGTRRAGAAILFDLARVFDVGAGYFLSSLVRECALRPAGGDPDQTAVADSLELMRSFALIDDPQTRRLIVTFAYALALRADD